MGMNKKLLPPDWYERLIESAEYKAQLAQNPAFAAHEAQRLQAMEQHRLAVLPVLEDLAAVGLMYDSLDDLRESGLKYKAAIPVLLRWLPRISNGDVKESIVRTLSVPWARPVAAIPMIEEFRKAPDRSISSLGWAIGSGLSIVADDSVFNEIAELVLDKRYGRSREMLAFALGRMRDPRAVGLLIELLDDEQMTGHALCGLGKLKPRPAGIRSHVEPFLNHPKAWIRKEAKKLLAKLPE